MSIKISFEGVSPAEQSQSAQILLNHLRDALTEDGVRLSLEREDPNSLDVGSTILIAASAVIANVAIEVTGKAIAEVLKDYVEQWYRSKIRVQGNGVDVTIDATAQPADLSEKISSALNITKDKKV